MADSRIEELRRRLERDPESRLFAQLAEELRKDGELEEAIGVARAGLEKHPNYSSARLTLGRALLDSGDPAAARAELDAAVQGAPDNILASRLLGEALETLGDLGSALEQYQRTLQMAPGDGHVEARIRAIQTRLGAPGDSGGGGQAAADGVPGQMAEAAAGELDDDEDGGLPPTIRIRMPGDAPRPGRAPLPPAAGTASETTLPTAGGPAPLATDGEAASSELPVTLPMPGAERTGETPEAETDTGEVVEERPEEGAGEAPPAADAAGPEAAAPPQEPEIESRPYPAEKRADSDLAPTLPKSRAAEYAVAGTELPPTLAPGVVTSVDGADGEPAPADDQAGAAAAGPGRPASPTAVTERIPPPPLPAEAEAAAEAWAEPPTPLAEEAPAEAPFEPREETAAGPPPDGPPEEPLNETPPPGDAAGAPESAPLSSATLAELYFEQGLLERAVEVYRQVLEEEPSNEGARGRLAEIESLVGEGAAALEVPPPDAGDPEARRRALERTIQRLEALLEVVRRR